MIMTTATRPPKPERRARYTELPNPPKKIDMLQHKYISRAHTILEKHYEDDPSTLVGGAGYLKRVPEERTGFAVPDCVVAFGVESDAIIRAKGYVISEIGKPPDFVLEVASETTGVRDYTIKRRIYRGMRAGEYWRFDPTGGRYHDAPLAGEILGADGEYRDADIRSDPDGTFWGYSPALHLWLVWQDGALRFYNPETGEFLRNLSEAEKRGDEAVRRAESERTARIESERGKADAERRRDEAEFRAASEQDARIDAEVRAASERRARVESERNAASEQDARIDAERRAASERAARIEAEAELVRLRRLLADLE